MSKVLAFTLITGITISMAGMAYSMVYGHIDFNTLTYNREYGIGFALFLLGPLISVGLLETYFLYLKHKGAKINAE